VFDGLTGTEAAGRRALIEVEDHLRAAVSDERGRGLSPAAAERAPVTRFGSPAKIARDIRTAHRNLVLAENPIRAGQTVCTVLAWDERIRGWPHQSAGWA
jgi:hypothetical protein